MFEAFGFYFRKNKPIFMGFSLPKLIIIGGFPGAGKTTIATELSKDFNLPLFSSDAFGKSLAKLTNKYLESSNLNPVVYPIAYDLLFEIIKYNLKNGLTLILDANMCQSQTWESVEMLKENLPELQCLPIVLDITLELAKDRVQKRKEIDPDNHDLDSSGIEKIMEKFEFIKNFSYPGLIKIDAGQDVENVYSDVVRFVKEFIK